MWMSCWVATTQHHRELRKLRETGIDIGFVEAD
jgi:hypothetical protein